MKNFKLIGLTLLLTMFHAAVGWGQVTQVPGSTPGVAGIGDVSGPASATAGNISTLDATGKVLSDSGVAPSVLTRKYFGTTTPGSVAGNLPGDTFDDTTNHIRYFCDAPSGTAAPACTAVALGGWTKLAAFDANGNLVIGATVLTPTVGVLVPVTFSTSGVLHSGTYTSGITATGSAGQTCALTSLNGAGSSATATVALTGTNVVAAGTALVITAAGSGYTSSPTSSTAGNGTATCSGTVVIAAYLTVSPVTGFHLANLTEGNAAYVLPAITSGTVGNQMCIRNAVAKTGKLKLVAPASTYLDLYGANGSAAGTLVSNGAAGDAMCVMAVTTTQYVTFPGAGIWTSN